MKVRDFPEKVAEIIIRYNMVSPGARLGIAVSGGGDSLVLLHVLHRLASRFCYQLFVLHCNHLLRGAESDADEEFVRQAAAALSVPFFRSRAPLGSGNLEQQARNARREYFTQMRETLDLAAVAAGHHRGDQAETVLLRFLRGAGTVGLAGMPRVSADGLIRPFLDFAQPEIRDWGLQEGIPWREDSTNALSTFRRNRLRLEVLPILTRDYNPNLEGVLAGMADLAEAENAYWKQIVNEAWLRIGGKNRFGVTLRLEELRVLPLALRRRLVRYAIGLAKGDLRAVDLLHVDSILLLVDSPHGHDRVMIPGTDALRSFETLLLALPGDLSKSRNYAFPVLFGQENILPFGAGHLCLYRLDEESPNCANFKEVGHLDAESSDADAALLGAGQLTVRNWEPGDALQRTGQDAIKLKHLFQEHRIPLWERRHWPVVVRDQEIVWTRQFGCSIQFEASPNCESAVKIVYQPSE